MADYRSGLRRARGLGSAKHGAGHWIGERVSAVALIPLVIWAVQSALMLSVADYQTAALWVQKPLNAVLLVLLIATGFRHMHAGLRVVVEDYVENALALLGEPGEWYRDRREGTVYYLPLDGERPDECEFVAPALERLFFMQS